MPITCTINLVDICASDYANQKYDICVSIGPMGTIADLRDSVNMSMQNTSQDYEDENGERRDWSDRHWSAFADALNSDVTESDLREVNEAWNDALNEAQSESECSDPDNLDEVCAINSDGDCDHCGESLTESFDSYIYGTIEFEDDGFPDDDSEWIGIVALSAFASALINGDRSGCDSSDERWLDIIASKYGEAIDCRPDSSYGLCEVTGLRGDTEIYWFRRDHVPTAPKGPELLPDGVTIDDCDVCGFGHRSDHFSDCRADWYGLIQIDQDEYSLAIYLDSNGSLWTNREVYKDS